MSKSPSIIFPEMQQQSAAAAKFSKNEFQSLCDLTPFPELVRGMASFAVQKYKTSQMKKQYSAGAAAVDAEYTEAEKQARIHFQELTKQLEIDFEAKTKELRLCLLKAEAEADKAYLENKTAFEEYLRTSAICGQILNMLIESSKRIAEIIKYAKEKDIATNTKYYVRLTEQYRLLMRGIDKCSGLIA